MSPELRAFLREEVGITQHKTEYQQPTREQALAKGWYNTMNMEKDEDGQWQPLF